MDDVSTLVSVIEFKVRQLIIRTKSLQNENDTYNSEINKLKKDNEEQKQIIKGLEEKIRILKIARISEVKENTSDTKAMISELVREIDKCIGLLNT
jgi:cell division protein FtsL